MKKILATLLIMSALITFCAAQSAYPLYKMQSTVKADAVLKALNSELSLSEPQFTKIRELLYGSVNGQAEVFQKPENLSAEMVEAVMRRQTGHIEGNLEEILGKDKFKLYLQKKSAIEKQITK